MTSAEEQLAYYRERVDKTIEKQIPETTASPTFLNQAIHYSLFNGGKRVRPLLMYATAEALGIPADKIDIPAAAIEMIHAYSLVHDDLPAMDDDMLRRGKPTCHIAFDEATAILAGDALQTQAFHLLAKTTNVDSTSSLTASQALKLVYLLSDASGANGMVGGQSLDLSSTGKHLSEQALENIHRHKTGALIRCSIQMACYCQDNMHPEQLSHLEQFANAIGLAFQVRDDILDIESDTETLGKQQGKDIQDNKATYPAILGLEQAKVKMFSLYDEATYHLNKSQAISDEISPKNSNHKLLQYITDYIVKRLK